MGQNGFSPDRTSISSSSFLTISAKLKSGPKSFRYISHCLTSKQMPVTRVSGPNNSLLCLFSLIKSWIVSLKVGILNYASKIFERLPLRPNFYFTPSYLISSNVNLSVNISEISLSKKSIYLNSFNYSYFSFPNRSTISVIFVKQGSWKIII